MRKRAGIARKVGKQPRSDISEVLAPATLYTRFIIGSGNDGVYQVRMKSRDVIKKITAAGWYEIRVKGSHHQFRHAALKGIVTVPHPEHDLPKGTLRSVERQSGVKLN